MSEQAQIEGLHQRAAESYLQGQFDEALLSWRELLELDPQDERAIEGIRLCELIVQQAADNGFGEPPSEQARSAAPPVLGPGEGSDVDFDEIESIMKESEEEERQAEPEAGAEDGLGWDLSDFAEPEPSGEGLDLADLPDLMPDPVESPLSLDIFATPAAPAADAGDDFDIPGLDLDLPEDTSGPGAAEEIEGRVADLLSQASTSYDAGDVEGAMTLLERVFILDAQNAAALALATAFRADIEAQDLPEPGAGPEPDAVADEALESLGLASPSAAATDETTADGSEMPLVPTPPELATGDGDGALDGLDEGPDLVSGASIDAAAEHSKAAARTRPPRERLMIGLAIMLLVAAAGTFAFRMMRPSAADASLDEALRRAKAVKTVKPVAQVVPTDPTQDGTEVDGANVEIVPTPDPPPEDLSSVIARARAAYEEGNFSHAVVVYNEALRLAPNDADARRGLTSAGAAYQEQREFTAKLDLATGAYSRGEYREALRLFYRLPGTDGVARFDRFKANGWYNLGLSALKSGSCSEARSHLDEAGALIPGDAGVARAAKFARSCASAQSDALWQTDVQRLEPRGLDD